ncbi:tRNA (adenosine(37)-N6)-threonylcarbamoyltransferase complex ATPase subunit type 1 TsaE [Asticcacaulis sp. BYS171W]|uniref:tRNA threonylcarbamoyladenosine biosynthesis protein TsaE n=1 Tax=Asticcacaulis aquaticus TaxID=2984212 RepID=A0ABT5HSC5_9CAUL|nr:tRNA (adenosine(37)-N6)-threonylcarbamoyltransferase complex ATPase subunit type 1 TsaE [Asticcacaulis aquaticus]MDC7682961.1 tRNA (adenosine(37)-N6)-threonylcarbamoyltransferase complex ATPase subunit type 1 TsaE [Asticcacaulis aquaticus]
MSDTFLKDEAETIAYGAWLAGELKAGDVVYLLGDLGAGKSTLARGLIRALTSPDEDVPSPTFTLVQTYEGQSVDIAHFDLYRLTDPEEIYEVGLFELAETHICLIEWPQRLGHLGFDAPWVVRLKQQVNEAGDAGRSVSLTRPEQVAG